MNVVFLGPPGSGKGTQAKRLASEFGLTHLSTGDVFREAIGGGTELGIEIKSYVDNGKLVPDELVSRVVFEHLKKLGAGASVLLDGYPRTVDQAKSLDGFAKRESMSINAIVFFDIESTELLNRLTARRQCKKCNEVFNLVSKQPKKEGVCDNCGGELFQRKDDTAEVIQNRLDVYNRQTAPVLDYYKNQPSFFKVNAKQDINTVFEDVKKPLMNLRTAAR